MKYRKQISKFDCAPTVIVNIHTWAGTSVNYSKLKCDLKFKKNVGTNRTHFHKFIKRYKVPFKVQNIIVNPTIKDFRRHLDKGNVIVFGVDFGHAAHIGLVIKMTKHYVTMVNWFGTGVTRKFHVSTLKAMLDEWSIMYSVKKS